MAQFFGLLIVINGIVITGFLFYTTGKLHFLWLGAFIVVAGVLLLITERIVEISYKGFNIKAVAEKAIIDARQISEIKGRIETQSATVDLVAKSADDARNLVRSLEKKNSDIESKVGKIDSDVQKSDKVLANLEKMNDFSSVLLAAQNDDAKAYEQLTKWIDKKDTPFWKIAANAVVKIRADAGGPIEPGFINIDWKGIDPKSFSFPQITSVITAFLPIFHTALVHEVQNRSDFSKKDKMQFYIEILHSSNSLSAKNCAGKFFIAETGDSNLKWQPFSTSELFDWWNKNKDKV